MGNPRPSRKMGITTKPYRRWGGSRKPAPPPCAGDMLIGLQHLRLQRGAAEVLRDVSPAWTKERFMACRGATVPAKAQPSPW